jgi:hypothetical protein
VMISKLVLSIYSKFQITVKPFMVMVHSIEMENICTLPKQVMSENAINITKITMVGLTIIKLYIYLVLIQKMIH